MWYWNWKLWQYHCKWSDFFCFIYLGKIWSQFLWFAIFVKELNRKCTHSKCHVILVIIACMYFFCLLSLTCLCLHVHFLSLKLQIQQFGYNFNIKNSMKRNTVKTETNTIPSLLFILYIFSQQKEKETLNLSKQLEVLGNQIKELSSSSGLDSNSVVSLKKKVWELESSVAEQSQQLVEQANSIQHLEQVIL